MCTKIGTFQKLIPLQLFKSYCAECDKFYKNHLSHGKNISWNVRQNEENLLLLIQNGFRALVLTFCNRNNCRWSRKWCLYPQFKLLKEFYKILYWKNPNPGSTVFSCRQTQCNLVFVFLLILILLILLKFKWSVIRKQHWEQIFFIHSSQKIFNH